MGQRRSLRSCITIEGATFGVLRTVKGSKMTKVSSRCDGLWSRNMDIPVTNGRRWKLLLGPTEPPAALKDQMSAGLPMGKTIVDIFSDFIRYLFDSTKALFISSDHNGEHRWNSVSRNIELVLTHPNGWGGPQQSQLRTAAVRANIVPDTPEGHARVHFVTEGEASFNFCATNTQTGENLKVWHCRHHFLHVLRCLTRR